MEISEIIQHLKELEALTDGDKKARLVLNANGSGYIEIDDQWDISIEEFMTLGDVADTFERMKQVIIEWLDEGER